ncbi:sterol desaturase family protein [Aurantibacillus circumpalustris]|uniref:sterol desaturase family protein n=1 Tax=Aurantibacillus circumpalustris TaxID=3036359 RepID=UPI00295B0874|nr:sterol desaturase family protein [Aurantibacillus circumpalustris]
MMLVVYVGIFILTFLSMEGVAWFSHKYIMHGLLWSLHKSHHVGHKGFFEKNDLFAFVFAIPSWLFIMLGVIYQSPVSIWIGSGMTAYGAAYFLVHDIIVHQRVKWFRKLDNKYVKAVRRAHKMHHKHLDKENGEAFGFLIVNKKYFQ